MTVGIRAFGGVLSNMADSGEQEQGAGASMVEEQTGQGKRKGTTKPRDPSRVREDLGDMEVRLAKMERHLITGDDRFEEIESRLMELGMALKQEPVLKLPDYSSPFEVHTDAFDFAIGGVILQGRHPIAFESRKLNETERRYTVQEKEMAAVVHCLRTWRHYLLGSRFTVKTDNVATSYFLTQKKLSPKQARWQAFLGEFDFVMEYKPGKANLVADALSRKVELAATNIQPNPSLMERIVEGLQHDP
ncbi:hypothetical protein GH714_021208 [Hevea brasiliensis]|uniref:Reverse transcriptase RNase H-like domain-containing protein n=1 Tax=Hevea brasiliensis TaxID=3981 RepID=A0A6A6LRL8_HEVBR|nr:hypothetical protein GH714_021208 [Hevea brasiliensis]